MQREHGILERGCSIYIRDFQTLILFISYGFIHYWYQPYSIIQLPNSSIFP
jgi:hypothetical protein